MRMTNIIQVILMIMNALMISLHTMENQNSKKSTFKLYLVKNLTENSKKNLGYGLSRSNVWPSCNLLARISILTY